MCRPMPIKGLPDKDDYGRKTLFSRRVAWSRAETLKSQLPLIIVAATAVSLVIIYFVYQGLVRSKCDSIFEQTANRLSGNLEFIKIKGELVLGREKVQELTEGSQKVALHLKTCCIAQQAGTLNADQFQVCMNGEGL